MRVKPRKWGFGEPSTDLGKSCAVMSTDTMTLKTVPCNHSYTFLCHKQGNLFRTIMYLCSILVFIPKNLLGGNNHNNKK